MKTLKIACLALLPTLFAAQTTKAQEFKNVLLGSWNIGLPMNSDYLTKTSFAGFRVDYRRFIKPNLSVGFSTGWQSFEQYFDTQSYNSSDGNTTVTTDMYRIVYNVPFMVNAHYYFDAGKYVKPYAGFGIGCMYSEQTAYFNIYELDDNGMGFAIRPEIGALINISDQFIGNVGFNYQFATNKSDFFNINSLSELDIQIGVGFRF
jgi:opacity protein-like surface antigen